MRLKMLTCLFMFYSFTTLFAGPALILDEDSRKKESERLHQLSLEVAKFYEMPDGMNLKEITEDVLQSPLVKEPQKQLIRDFGRRLFLFLYPSDGLFVKGLISFVPSCSDQPSLVVLRGGNRLFGILNPGNEFLCARQYTVIAPAYRGGVSEGEDEFGGEDVNDVKNLIAFLPQLESRLAQSFQTDKMFLVGGSRGGMQMFLALARFPDLQSRFKKIVSLSGMLDMHQCIATRPDMKDMFIKDFGLQEGVNEEEWINKRNPILAADRIDPSLPILIIQGTADNRVSLEEGYHMVNQLQLNGSQATYWEIEGATHCLGNIADRMERILNWLEE